MVVMKSRRPERRHNAVTEQGSSVLLRPSDRSSTPITVKALFEQLTPAINDEALVLEPGEAYPFIVDLHYRDVPAYFIETRLGLMAVERIRFHSTVRVSASGATVEETLGYSQKSPDRQEISQKVTLRTHSIDGTEFAVELHRLANSGKFHLLLDRVE
jgi:hypothetical protein